LLGRVIEYAPDAEVVAVQTAYAAAPHSGKVQNITGMPPMALTPSVIVPANTQVVEAFGRAAAGTA
jgi:hypothetical protein